MRTITLIRETIAELGHARGSLLASSIAYYALLSLFPMILGLLAILGVVVRAPSARAQIVRGIAAAFPGSETFIVLTIDQLARGSESAGIVATLGLLWSASGVFAAITTALDTIWRVPHRRTLLQSSVIAIALVFGVALIFVVSLVLSAALTLAAEARLPLFNVPLASLPLLLPLTSVILPFVFTIAVLSLLYRFVPNLPLGWNAAWPGAVLASALLDVGKEVFVWYLTRFAHLNAVYGPIGTVIGLVTWAYYAALIVLIGAAFNAALTRSRRPA